MREKKILEVPKETTKDVLQRLLSAAISEVPRGTLATDFFHIMFIPAVEKRKESFLKDVLTSLSALEQTNQGFKLPELGSNERFVTALLQVVPIATKTHQKKKLEALRNATLNTAMGNKFAEQELLEVPQP